MRFQPLQSPCVCVSLAWVCVTSACPRRSIIFTDQVVNGTSAEFDWQHLGSHLQGNSPTFPALPRLSLDKAGTDTAQLILRTTFKNHFSNAWTHWNVLDRENNCDCKQTWMRMDRAHLLRPQLSLASFPFACVDSAWRSWEGVGFFKRLTAVRC